MYIILQCICVCVYLSACRENITHTKEYCIYQILKGCYLLEATNGAAGLSAVLLALVSFCNLETCSYEVTKHFAKYDSVGISTV